MFNNVTKTCSGADASWEILSMLAGAFLLGCLLCWLIGKFRSSGNPPENRQTHHDNEQNGGYGQTTKNIGPSQTYQNKQPASLSSSSKGVASQAKQSYQVRKVSEEQASAYSTPKIDDLTKISSIDVKTESILRDHGIKSFIDLRDADHKKMHAVMESPNFDIPANEVETWPHQARLAAKGEWKKLIDYQAFKERSRHNIDTINASRQSVDKPVSVNEKILKTSPDAAVKNKQDKDDLTRIAGITPAIEKTLNQKGVYTFEQLYALDDHDLEQYLAGHGADANRKIDSESIRQQAELAQSGNWEELEEYQDYLNIKNSALEGLSSNAEQDLNLSEEDSDSNRIDYEKYLGGKTTSNVNESKMARDTDTKTLDENAPDDENIKSKTSNISSDAPDETDNQTVKSNEKSTSRDDLRKIEGIGPKIQQVLNQHNIMTFKQLSESDRDTLKAYLDEAGPQFKMHEPASWPHQASMAYRGEWDKLKEYQDFMVGGRDDSVSLHVSYSKDSMENEENEESKDKNSNKPNQSSTDVEKGNDLTKIEGIGPKIKEVLNQNGIYTFEQLHKTTRNTLKAYLDKAGPQFKMHEPESWPHQAGMAYRGEWEKLKEYQEFMVGGRDDIMSLSSTSKGAFSRESSTNAENDDNTDDTSDNFVDDLTKIEGIGPKIEQLLNEAGILNFAQLKSASRDTLKAILDEGGPQFKMHEPETWPKQAELADSGEWKKLKEYQDVLIGGR